jgi:4-carboxymuconolactone decarboxylase
MAKLPELDLSQIPEMAEAAKRIQESRGWVSNLMKTMAHSPEGVKRHMAYGHYLRFETDLTEVQRELTICATVRNVDYGWKHHGGLLKQLGISDAQMVTLKKGEVPEGLSQADSALCKFIFAFSSYKGIPDEVLAEARKYFSERQIIDMSLLSAYLKFRSSPRKCSSLSWTGRPIGPTRPFANGSVRHCLTLILPDTPAASGCVRSNSLFIGAVVHV